MRRTLEGTRVGWGVCVLVLASRMHSCVGFPPGQPTKFSLNTNEASQKAVAPQTGSAIEQGRELLGRIADAIRIGTGRFVNSVTLARNIIAERWEQAVESRSDQALLEITTQFLLPTDLESRTGETVTLVNKSGQGLLEQPISKPITGILESLFHPAPLIDHTKREEQLGNTGRFSGLGKAVVDGYEGFSNFLNSLIEIPRSAVRNKSKGITEMLDRVGAKLIGFT